MTLLTGLKFGWHELFTAEDAQLWMHTHLNATLLFDVMLFYFFATVLMTNIHMFIQSPRAPATGWRQI